MSKSFEDIANITFAHLRNIDGTGLSYIATGLYCTPLDPVSFTSTYLYNQDYPIEKLFGLLLTFTTYSGLLSGDYLEIIGGTRYPIKAAQWDAPMYSAEATYTIVLEEPYGS
jgi:hypothetical protein